MHEMLVLVKTWPLESDDPCHVELSVGLHQICQHNKKHNRPEYYAGIMLA